jgi:hypothetical protein
VHQARLLQHGQVLGNRRRGQSQQLDDLAEAQFAPPQRQQRPDAILVRQRSRDGKEFVHDSIAHFANQRNNTMPGRVSQVTRRFMFHTPFGV